MTLLVYGEINEIDEGATDFLHLKPSFCPLHQSRERMTLLVYELFFTKIICRELNVPGQ